MKTFRILISALLVVTLLVGATPAAVSAAPSTGTPTPPPATPALSKTITLALTWSGNMISFPAPKIDAGWQIVWVVISEDNPNSHVSNIVYATATTVNGVTKYSATMSHLEKNKAVLNVSIMIKPTTNGVPLCSYDTGKVSTGTTSVTAKKNLLCPAK